MNVVIQCAARKQPDAGYFRDHQNKRICFVAQPALAPASSTCRYVRPDDLTDGATWRNLLEAYNGRNSNPYGLLPAWRLYANPAYAALVDKLGVGRVYILSAGWGLLRADYLTPCYDITFSNMADKYKRRNKHDAYADFNQLPLDNKAELAFFGSKDYLPLFCSLTAAYHGKRRVYFNSAQSLSAPGCELLRFETSTRTNWHYECVRAFLAGTC